MQSSEPSTFRAYYGEAHNAIVMPHLPQYYFRKRWMPELGPTATCIVLYLRGLCMQSTEKVSACEVKLEVIAQGIGVSRPTIARELRMHQEDDPAKGIRKGDMVNATLQHFIQGRHIKNLTDNGVRNGANEYLIRLDDPIHPDDMAYYELLCKQQQERGNTGNQTQIRDRRTTVPEAIPPGYQNDTQAPRTEPGYQNDTQALREKNAPGYQNDTYIPNVFVKNVSTLNVKGENINNKNGGGETKFEATREDSASPKDLTEELIQRYVAEVLRITKDAKSERRYYQLVGICEKNNCLSIVDTAMRATQAGVDAGTVPNPGAYCQKIITTKLADRGVHVPSAKEKAEKPNIAAAIRGGLGEDLGQGITTPVPPAAPRPTPAQAAGASAKGDELAQIAALKEQGGEAWASWQQFMEARRDEYRKVVLNPSLLQRSLSGLESPEQQRAYWRKWIQSRG